MGIEQFDQLCKVGKRSGQPVDLIDDDDIDLAGADILQKPLQVRTVGVTAIIISGPDQVQPAWAWLL